MNDFDRAFEHADRPTEPDDLAFWRGLVTGVCLSVCFWIAIGGGIWAFAKEVF